MLRLRINDKFYAVYVEPVEYMDGMGWTSSIMPRVTVETSEEIDRNHWADWPGGFVDMIYFAMVDGWATSGTLREDDPDFEPLYWAIEQDGVLIGRDDLHTLLNPAEE